MKDSTMAAVDALVDQLAERDGSDDFTVAAEMVRTAGLDVAYALATAALIGSARTKRRTVALSVERAHQHDKRQQLHEKAGPTPEEQQRWIEADMAIQQKMNDGIQQAIERYTREVRMQWEAELLASTFTLGDGSLVTWGAATIEQHEERAAMFQRNAMANVEGYARHQRAINDLRESGAGTLSEMVSATAA